eukprot:snap_masked-scaffold_30-processed-gene-3.90-mRNA-1 protein AED:1.00 eAED:1.00 QI:0/0/0/0/1/1/3/0/60
MKIFRLLQRESFCANASAVRSFLYGNINESSFEEGNNYIRFSCIHKSYYQGTSILFLSFI